jgi:hypothetical protein
MNMKNYFIQHPKRLFLLDGVGAALSLLTLLVLFFFFQEEVGFSTDVFVVLIVGAVSLFAFDAFCYFNVDPPFQRYILLMAVSNVAYSVFVAVGLLYHSAEISLFTWIYFSLEIFILALLVRLELKVAFEANGEGE